MKNNNLPKKGGIIGVLFLVILLFEINKNSTYQSETTIMLLPKSKIAAQEIDLIAGNFKQIIFSLTFCDELAEQNGAISSVRDLPNYKRKDFCNTKLEVSRLNESTMLSIKNFDQNGTVAQELNSDVVDNLISIVGKYYNIKTDLELRIIDGPIVKKSLSQNLFLIILQSLLWTGLVFASVFFLIPFIFLKKEVDKQIPKKNFFPKMVAKKTVPETLPEEDNYFATKNFFKANFSGFGKKAPTPANLPINEEEVPDIFREKKALIKTNEQLEDKVEENQEYIPREATQEEVKERLNKLLRGEK